MVLLVFKLILINTALAGYFGNAFNETKCNANCLPPTLNVRKCDTLSRNCIYGCIHGWYGKKCNKPCSSKCLNRSCFQDSGSCQGGCVTGWYGNKCNKPCWTSCFNKSCIQSSGRCTGGCVPSWYGDTCNKPCKSTCLNRACLQDSGSCVNGCVSGWFGDKCNIPCGSSCFNKTCLQTSGFCSHGCIPGWYGKHCELNCFETCRGNSCDVETIACMTECGIEYTGLNCNTTSRTVHVSHVYTYIGGLVGVVISLSFVVIIWIIRRFITKGNCCKNQKCSTAETAQPNYDDIYNVEGLDTSESNEYLENAYEQISDLCELSSVAMANLDPEATSSDDKESVLWATTDSTHDDKNISEIYTKVIKHNPDKTVEVYNPLYCKYIQTRNKPSPLL